MIDIGDELTKYGINVTYCDPWVSEDDWDYLEIQPKALSELSKDYYDAIIVAVNHQEFKGQDAYIKSLCTPPSVVIDVKGALDNPDWRL